MGPRPLTTSAQAATDYQVRGHTLLCFNHHGYMSLQNGHFVDNWKDVLVLPILKKIGLGSRHY